MNICCTSLESSRQGTGQVVVQGWRPPDTREGVDGVKDSVHVRRPDGIVRIGEGLRHCGRDLVRTLCCARSNSIIYYSILGERFPKVPGMALTTIPKFLTEHR